MVDLSAFAARGLAAKKNKQDNNSQVPRLSSHHVAAPYQREEGYCKKTYNVIHIASKMSVVADHISAWTPLQIPPFCNVIFHLLFFSQ
jgi:hypothetical protein